MCDRGERRIEIRVRAGTLDALFECAARELLALLTPALGGDDDRVPVRLTAADPAMLLAEFLDEIVALLHLEGFAARRVERIELRGNTVRAALSGAGTGQAADRSILRVECCEVSRDDLPGRWEASVALTVTTNR